MRKGSTIFLIITLIGAVAFYKVNAFISIVFFLLFVGVAFGTGKLG
jgi:hypothetical protein